MTKRPQNFRYKWEHAFRAADLPSRAKNVGMILATYTTKHGERSFPGVKNLATGSGLGERTVQSALADLRDSGWIVLVREGRYRRGEADEYQLAIPSSNEKSGAPSGGTDATDVSLAAPSRASHAVGSSSDAARCPSSEQHHIKSTRTEGTEQCRTDNAEREDILSPFGDIAFVDSDDSDDPQMLTRDPEDEAGPSRSRRSGGYFTHRGPRRDEDEWEPFWRRH